MTRSRSNSSLLSQDERGSVMLESCVAFVPVFLGFLGLCHAIDSVTHDIIVRRAAAAAARAAVVVLPDDGVHYADPHNRAVHCFVGGRKAAIESAARAILRASPSFAEQILVTVSGEFSAGSTLTAHVAADYTCLLGLLRPLCGVDGKRRFMASATLPYQFAAYSYGDR